MRNSIESLSSVATVPIAVVRTPFAEKFGVPRQAGLATHAVGTIEFLPPFADAVMLDGLEGFSHIWLLSSFHQVAADGWNKKVRPPRLGGNRFLGLWATRTPFRPNPIGLSAVRLLAVETSPQPRLRVAGIDLVDGTPLLDIKPYVPYADAIDGAVGGFAADRPRMRLQVRFADRAERAATAIGLDDEVRALLGEIVGLDPRPSYHADKKVGRTYGIRVADIDVRWQVEGDIATIIDLVPLAES